MLDVFSRVIKLTKDHKAHLLLICGDLYEHSYVRKSTIAFIGKKFADIMNTKVVIIPGNHDPYVSNSYYANYEWPSNVYILRSGSNKIDFEDLNTCVYYFVPGIKIPPPKNTGRINILMLHGTLDIKMGRQYNPISMDELSHTGMDYIAAGHFHNYFVKEGQCSVYNPGSPEPLGFDEPGEHGVLKGYISKNKDETDMVFNKTALCEYIRFEVVLDRCLSNEEAADSINKAVYALDKHDGLVEITLAGTVEDGFSIDLEAVGNMIYKKVYHLKIKDKTRPCLNIGKLVKDGGLKGLFVENMLEKIKESKKEEELKILRRALDYGVQALENGEIKL